MIQTLQDLRYYLKEDAKRNQINDNYLIYSIKVIIGFENACIYRYIRNLRITEYFQNNSSVFHKCFFALYKCKLAHLGRKYNIYIPLNVCGYGLRIMHIVGGGGVLLNAHKIGNYCGFNSGVLIGNNGPEQKPTIGNYTSFGPGSKAFGNIHIGSNVFVASNAVVVKNIPDNSVVGGIPAKVIKTR